MTSDGRPANGRVVYLSTLGFPEPWLQELRAIDDRLVVVQQSCDTAADLSHELWRQIHILHTSAVFPHPSQAPNLGWVQLDTSGVDHVVGSELWKQTTVPVTTIGGVSARTMAEYVLLMLLAFSHRLPALLAGPQGRQWPGPADRWSLFQPAALAGSTVAIIGFGQIGRATGQLCAALGMDVVGIRRKAVESGAPVASGVSIGSWFPAGSVTETNIRALRQVLRRADAVVVTLPLTAQTRGLLDRDTLAAVKPGAVLVNVSRGGVVDETAVIELLTDGRLAGAALDVFEREPLPADDPLWSAPNLILTPHVAGFAPDYLSQVQALVKENLRRFLAGRPLLNQADREAGY